MWSGAVKAALLAASLFNLTGAPPRASEAALARGCFQPEEADLESHQHYHSRRDSCDVHGPAKSRDGAKPEGASAKCRDGTWSFSHNRSGTCSRHGGVERWESGSLMAPVADAGRIS